MSFTLQPIYEEWQWTRPSEADPFGPIVSGFEVEQALAMCVRRWMPDYLRAVEKQRGIPAGSLPVYRSEIPSATETGRVPENLLPSFAIVSRGYSDKPGTAGDGMVDARWQVDLHTVHAARGWGEARRVAQFYAAALRTVFLQHQSLDLEQLVLEEIPTPHPVPSHHRDASPNWLQYPEAPAARTAPITVLAVDVMAERYIIRRAGEERTHGEAVVPVQVHVAGIGTRDGGPWPMYEPGQVEDLPTVETYEIVFEKED